jgi:amino acid adenylation domain-containing protein
VNSELVGRLSQLDPRQRELFLKALQDQITSTVDNAIPERPAQGPLPLSFSQERLWFLNQLDPNSPFYNVGRVFSLDGKLSVEALGRSLAEVVRRHEVLRTRFPGDSVGAVQEVAASVDDELPYTDVRGANASERAYALAAEDVKRPFDVTSELPWRARVIQYGDAQYLFVLVLHHIAVDGWSLPILFRELSQFYRGFLERQSVESSPLRFQYAHFALWERRKWSNQDEGEREKQLSYWRNQLQNLPAVFSLPSDFQRTPLPANKGALEPVALSSEASFALSKFAADRRVSMATILFAGFHAVLARYMSRDDVVVLQTVSNRGRTEFEELIGLFVNTLPVRAELSGRLTFSQFVEQVQCVAMEAYASWDLPFEMILRAARPSPEHKMTSLTQFMFGFNDFPEYRLQLDGVVSTPIGLESINNGGAKADIELSLAANSGRVTGLIGYRTDLFLPPTIRRFWKHFSTLLERGVLAPETRVDQIPILSAGERRHFVGHGIDREEPRVPEQETRQITAVRVPPRNAVEETIRQIWTEVLGISPDKIAVFDSFFALGGDSLLATQVVARIRKKLNAGFPMRWIFEFPTIAALAERSMTEPGEIPEIRVAAGLADQGKVDAPNRDQSYEASGGIRSGAPVCAPHTETIRGGHVGPPLLSTNNPSRPACSVRSSSQTEQPIIKLAERQSFPLSFAQQRLWFIDRLISESSLYNVPVILRLAGRLNVEALRQSLIDLSARHEILRTRYVMADGQLRQRIESRQIELEIRDCVEGEAILEAQREAGRAFDLEKGPLFRAVLLRLTEDNQILVLTQHHSITDGLSLQVMSRELSAAYESRLQGREPDLPRLSIQYGDFAAWHARWVKEEVLESQLPYWRGQLAGVACLELPGDYQRPPNYSYRGATTRRRLPDSLNRSLRELTSREGTTLFMTLLAAFQALMFRYTGQNDIAVGTPIAGRNRIEIEPLIGFFVNTLVMRTRVDEQWSFRRLLQEVREVALGAYAHQDVPFEKLVEELQPRRDLSHTPLFQVLFGVDTTPNYQFEFAGLETSQIDLERLLSKFDLAVTFVEDGIQASLAAVFRSDLFEQETIDRLLNHFEALLRAAVENPEKELSRLSLMTEQERRELLQRTAWEQEHGWNSDSSIVELFEQQVQLRPEAIAVILDEESLTYRELNRRANQLAHHLRSLGAGPDVRIGMLMERSIEMVVGVLGILKAGAAYVPVEPSCPKERLAFMIEDACAPIILTLEHLAPLVSEYGARVLRLDSAWAEISKAGGENPVHQTAVDHLAYIIYTSGSTGKPKGTMVSHRNVVRLMEATQHWFEFDGDDVWTLFHSYAFDFSVWEIWGALLNGGKLVIVPYLLSRTPEAFYELMCERQVTVLNQTPSAFGSLIAAEQRLGESRDMSLRLVIFGGEALELHSLKPWFERHGDAKPVLVNMYGITETTVHVTYRPISFDDVIRSNGSAIGMAIPDLRVYILDGQMEPAPIGVTGELFVAGAGLARGYLGRAALTAERYIPNPFGEEPGERLYRTGDLGRRKSDGEILYKGRCDQQVKVRGYRIELGEIAAVLKEHAEVREAIVIDRDEVPGKNLAAYVICNGNITPIELKEHLRDKLPDYMIPQSLVAIKEFPLTQNGKIDRGALLKLEIPSQQGGSRIPPANEMERRISQVWERFLPAEKVGVEDNFFDLGGHSLLATQVVWKLRETLPALTLLELFTYPTIRSLARHLSRAGAEESAADEGTSRAKLRLALRQRQKQTHRFAAS